MNCCEQALKCSPKSFKIWQNFILFSIETLQFYKAVHGVKRLLYYSELDTINASLLLRISECFIKRYIENERHEDDPELKLVEKEQLEQPLPDEEVLRHKKYLYKFYDDITEKINDYKIWRLIGRMK